MNNFLSYVFMAYVITCVIRENRGIKSSIKDIFSNYARSKNLTFRNLEQRNKKLEIFQNNLALIAHINSQNLSYTAGINKFAHLSNGEFNEIYCRTRVPHNYTTHRKRRSFRSTAKLPSFIDWRLRGYVTHVKDQGEATCGSCWAFSATGSLEGQHFKYTGNLVSLSEQNLIDCVYPGQGGCGGGWMGDAFDYIHSNKGINTEASYPYIGYDQACRFKRRRKVIATVSGYVNVDANEAALKKALATIGPISAAIDSGHPSFQHYNGGVYYEPNCSSSATQTTHAVLVVGYGTDRKQGAYWIVKNSWGEEWGINGYILMARNKKNNCGIASSLIYPTIAAPIQTRRRTTTTITTTTILPSQAPFITLTATQYPISTNYFVDTNSLESGILINNFLVSMTSSTITQTIKKSPTTSTETKIESKNTVKSITTSTKFTTFTSTKLTSSFSTSKTSTISSTKITTESKTTKKSTITSTKYATSISTITTTPTTIIVSTKTTSSPFTSKKVTITSTSTKTGILILTKITSSPYTTKTSITKITEIGKS